MPLPMATPTATRASAPTIKIGRAPCHVYRTTIFDLYSAPASSSRYSRTLRLTRHAAVSLDQIGAPPCQAAGRHGAVYES